MRQINRYSHQPFLTRELSKLLAVESFAYRSILTIGRELDYRLVEWPDQREVEFSSLFPVEALFIWILKNGGLDVEWLMDPDGRYRGDDGALLAKSIPRTLSGAEQLAAYGLWLIREEMGAFGQWDESDFDEAGVHLDGWAKHDALNHQGECLLLAYQALTYAQRLLLGTTLSADETAKAEKLDFSAMGKLGGAKRQEPMKRLRAWTLTRFKAGTWPSARQAGLDLADEVYDYGRTIGATMSKTNAARTIAEWIRNPDGPEQET